MNLEWKERKISEDSEEKDNDGEWDESGEKCEALDGEMARGKKRAIAECKVES